MISQRTPEPIDLAELDRLHVNGQPRTLACLTSEGFTRFGAAAVYAYPALRRVVEALHALIKHDDEAPGLNDDYSRTPEQTEALAVAIQQAREALSAFKLPEAG